MTIRYFLIFERGLKVVTRIINKPRLILCLLALFFLAPGLSAYFVYKHPQTFAFGQTNKGILLKTPLKITLPTASKNWHLVLWNPKSCDNHCLKILDKLARVRLALGRHWYEVDQWLVGLDDQKNPNMAFFLKQASIKNYVLKAEQEQDLSPYDKKPQIFLVDPEHYWIMRYSLNQNPDDIYKDLKKILAKNQ